MNNDIATNIINSKKLLSEKLFSFLSVLNINNVSINIVNELNSAYTDGSNIFIGYNLENPKKDFINANDKLDLYIGLLIHESSHVLYTDFNYCYKTNNICKYIQNILEDELIERKMSLKYPGYGKFLGKLKYFMFDDIDVFYNGDIKGESDLDKFLSILFYIIRYPKYLNKISNETIDKFKDVLNEVKNAMNYNNVFNYTSNNISFIVYNTTNVIYEILKKYFDINEINKNKKSFSKNSSTNKINEKINNTLNNRSLQINYKRSESYEVKNKSLNNYDKSLYNVYLNKIRKYIEYVKSILIKDNNNNNSFNYNRYRKSGLLDGSKLVSGILGNPNIYKRIEFSKTKNKSYKKTNIVLLVDNSGSMDSYKDIASKITILLYEGLKSINDINLYIYGHNDNLETYLDKNINNMNYFPIRKNGGCQSEKIVYSKIAEKFINANETTLIFNITDSKYLSNPQIIYSIINNAKLSNIYFGLITLNNDEKITYDIDSINYQLYGDNYTKYNGDFKILIDSIANNIKNFIKNRKH